MFEESDYLQKRIVTIMDNNCDDGGEPSIQSQIVKNGKGPGEYVNLQSSVQIKKILLLILSISMEPNI